MEILYSIFALVWAILGIILFFKIWGMTNDMKLLTREVHEIKMLVAQEHPSCKQEQKTEEVTNHNFNVGDYVTHKRYGGKMKVVGVNDGRITCDRGGFSGLKSYDASELDIIKE